MLKNIFRLKSFRKNIVLFIILIVLITIRDYRNIIPYSLREIAMKDAMLVIMSFLFCLLIDTVKEIKSVCKETKYSRNAFGIILFAFFLIFLTVIDIYGMLIWIW